MRICFTLFRIEQWQNVFTDFYFKKKKKRYLGVACTVWITHGQLAIKSCSSAIADSPSLCRFSGFDLLVFCLFVCLIVICCKKHWWLA